MAVKYLAGDRLIGTAAERTALTTAAAAIIGGTIDSFVWDWEWYRGANDTSDTSNSNSNKLFISSNTSGYDQSGESGTSRQFGWMYSSGNAIGILNHGTTETWTAYGSTQPTSTWRYFRMIYSESENKIRWANFTTDTLRNAMTWSSQTSAQEAEISGAVSGTNFSVGDDMKYITIESLTNTNASDWGLRNIKVWLHQETDSGDPDFNYQFPSTTGWNANASTIGTISSNEYTLDTGSNSSPVLTAVYTIPDTPAVYPNLTNGTIFEESDTGKHYMFDGTSAWNEM